MKKYTSIPQIDQTHFNHNFICLNLVAAKQWLLFKKKGIWNSYSSNHCAEQKRRLALLQGTAVHDVPCLFRKLAILSSALLVVSLKWPAEYKILKTGRYTLSIGPQNIQAPNSCKQSHSKGYFTCAHYSNIRLGTFVHENLLFDLLSVWSQTLKKKKCTSRIPRYTLQPPIVG